MSAPMAALSRRNRIKPPWNTTSTREVQQNNSNSPSIDEQSLVSGSGRSTDSSANSTFFDSLSRAILYLPQLLQSRTEPANDCDSRTTQSPERTSRPGSKAQEKSATQPEALQSIDTSLCRDAGEHTQPRTRVGLRKRLKEACKSALPNKEVCLGCYDDIPINRIIVAPCDHKYCPNCLEIPTKRVFSTLHLREKKAYRSRAHEHAAPAGARWYCPHPNCGRWIHQRDLTTRSKPLRCPCCRAVICLNCRDLAHDARECAVDNTLRDVLALAKKKHWQRCYRCHALVERREGCGHMKCFCKAEFCYLCGDPWPYLSCRGPEVAVADDVRRLEEDGDLDLTTMVAAMEQAEQEEEDAEI